MDKEYSTGRVPLRFHMDGDADSVDPDKTDFVVCSLAFYGTIQILMQ